MEKIFILPLIVILLTFLIALFKLKVKLRPRRYQYIYSKRRKLSGKPFIEFKKKEIALILTKKNGQLFYSDLVRLALYSFLIQEKYRVFPKVFFKVKGAKEKTPVNITQEDIKEALILAERARAFKMGSWIPGEDAVDPRKCRNCPHLHRCPFAKP